MAHNRQFVVPEALYVKSDVRRLVREIETITDTQHAAHIRKDAAPLEPSRLLQQLIEANTIDGTVPDYPELKRALTVLEKKAPVVHMSFAVNPTAEFMARIVGWFRQQVHPYVLIQVGLQPSIAAGCIIRTPSKHFDLTMRKHFAEKRAGLVKQLGALREQA